MSEICFRHCLQRRTDTTCGALVLLEYSMINTISRPKGPRNRAIRNARTLSPVAMIEAMAAQTKVIAAPISMISMTQRPLESLCLCLPWLHFKQHLSRLLSCSLLYGHHCADLLACWYGNMLFADRAGKRLSSILLVIVDDGATVFTGPDQFVFLNPDFHAFIAAAGADNRRCRDARATDITVPEINQHGDYDTQRAEQEADSKGLGRVAILNQGRNRTTDKI